MTFSERLRETRVLAGVSASALSQAVGPSRDIVRQIEAGEIARPNVELAGALARALGVSLDWLLDGTGPGPTARALRLAAARLTETP